MPRRGDSLETRWSRPPHTKAKHDLLVRYLQAWFPIMGRTVRRAVVLDAFAGPGRYKQGEAGSPVLVVEALLDHRDFRNWSTCEFVLVFNELDAERFTSLGEVLQEICQERAPWPANVKMPAPRNQSFEDLARDMLASLNGNQLAPAFAFLDPFGFSGIPLHLIAELVSFPKCELFIYFDINNINRFATAGNVDPHLEALFGTDEYRQAPPAGDPRRQRFLHDLYERQLKAAANFAHIRSFAMHNEQGLLGNYLFFCTRDLQAFNRMKEAMWKLDPSGEYRFEDRLAGQDVLFGDENATGPLRDHLLEHYAGQTVPIQQIVNHVVADTPFHEGQIKRKTLAPMQRENLIDAVGQQRRCQFPDGVSVVFPG